MIGKTTFAVALLCTAVGAVGIVHYLRGQRELEALRAQVGAKEAPSLGAVQSVEAPTPRPSPDRGAEPSPEVRLVRRVTQTQNDPVALAALLAEANRPENRAITYAHLRKNADKYFGRPWTTRGRVIELHEGNVVEGRITLAGYAQIPVWFWMPGRTETEFVQGDIVDVVGYLSGPYTYKTEEGWTLTVPSMLVHSMARPGGLRGATHPRQRKDWDQSPIVDKLLAEPSEQAEAPPGRVALAPPSLW